jgi:DNA-binding HxlR family transcriptional regulator
MAARPYGQFCALARALEHVGERWTLLIVRELLLGPCSFAGLQRALPGISPTVLAERLDGLQADGLAVRNAAPQRSKSVTYTLTTAGQELEPVVMALMRWGSRWMLDGPQDDVCHSAWMPLALRSVLDGPVPSGLATGAVQLHVDQTDVAVVISGRKRRVSAGLVKRPAASVTCSAPELFGALAGGRAAVEQLAVTGAADVVRDALTLTVGS